MAIGKEADRLAKIMKSSQTIRNSADTVLEEARKMQANLERRSAELADHVRTIKVALVEA